VLFTILSLFVVVVAVVIAVCSRTLLCSCGVHHSFIVTRTNHRHRMMLYVPPTVVPRSLFASAAVVARTTDTIQYNTIQYNTNHTRTHNHRYSISVLYNRKKSGREYGALLLLLLLLKKKYSFRFRFHSTPLHSTPHYSQSSCLI